MNSESPYPDAAPSLDVCWGVSPGMQAAIDLARAEMAGLLAKHGGEWVAYCGDEEGRGAERLGFAQTETELSEQFNPQGEISDRFFTAVVMEGSLNPEEDDEDLFL